MKNKHEWDYTHMSMELKEYPDCCEMIWDNRKRGGSPDNYISIFNGFSFTNLRYYIVAVGKGDIYYRTFREDPDVTKVYRVDYTTLEPMGEPLPDHKFTVREEVEEVNNDYHSFLPPEARSFAKYYGFGKDEYVVPEGWS